MENNGKLIHKRNIDISLAIFNINDEMGKYVAESLVKNLIKADIPVKTAKVAVSGLFQFFHHFIKIFPGLPAMQLFVPVFRHDQKRMG